MSEYSAELARQHADAIVARLDDDPSFEERLRANPLGELAAFGVPSDVAEQVLSAVGAPADVDGFGMSALHTFSPLIAHNAFSRATATYGCADTVGIGCTVGAPTAQQQQKWCSGPIA